MDNELNPKESLKVIDQMIAQAKYRSHPSEGLITLSWGFLTMLAALLHWYLAVVQNAPYASMAWLLMLVGAVITAVMSIKMKREKPVKTYVDVQVGQIWLAFLASYAVLFFAVSASNVLFLPTVILLYGTAQWVHGSLLKFIPYQAGAVVFWLASGVAFQLQQEQQLLILAAAVVLGFIVPGYLLRAKSSTHHV